MHHHLATLHLRSRTSLHRRCRLSNKPQGHRLHRRQLLPQRRRPRPPRPWEPRPSRGRPKMTLLPQPRIMHHHQNGRLVVSGEERVVDNSRLIIFPPFFLSCVFCYPYLYALCVRFTFHTRHLGNLLVFLLSTSQSPLSSPCFYLLFYRRLYSSNDLILPFSSPFASSLLPPCRYCVFSAVSCWSSSGYIRAAVFLFI